jgi:predicted HTH transcriptional regulator
MEGKLINITYNEQNNSILLRNYVGLSNFDIKKALEFTDTQNNALIIFGLKDKNNNIIQFQTKGSISF